MSALAVAPSAVAQQTSPASSAPDERIDFAIEAQPLASALAEFARQSGLSTLFSTDRLRGASAPTVRGAFTREEALALLFSQSSWEASIQENSIVLIERQASAGSDEEIVVTGTRIRGEAPIGAHVIALDRTAIADSGYGSADQLTRALPQNYGGGFGQNIAFTNSNTGGGSAVNLRGLGADATLTLLNGRRLPVMGSDSNYADISTIPLTAIERIEVLPDSASAVYGSDAVGGVVNFILRRDFDGVEIGFRHGAVSSGGLEETRINGAVGGRLGNLRAFAAYERLERTALEMSDRDYLVDADLRSLGGDNFRNTRGNPTTLNVTGLGMFAVPFGQDGSDLEQSDLIAGVRNFENQNVGVNALPESTQDALYVTVSYDLSPQIELYGDARFVSREFVSRVTHTNARITIPNTNAFRAVNNLFPGRTVTADYDFYRDIGPRTEVGDFETIDLAAGIRFDVSETWRVEPLLSYARVGGEQLSQNMVNTTALNVALASSDPAVAFNPFGDGSYTSADTLASIRGYSRDELISEVWSAGVKADGVVLAAPAGPVRLAVGGDYRQEFFDISGETFVNGTAPIPVVSSSNGRNVTALYAEVLVPMFGGPFEPPVGESLDLSLALRGERYSDFGDTVNPRIGANWAITENLSVRGSWGQSFRAPNLSDLDTTNEGNRRLVRAQNSVDPGSPSGRSNLILILGANASLTEQRADTWSAGVNYQNRDFYDLHLDLNYFNVRFSDRISSLSNLTTALTPGSEFSTLVDRAPDPATIAALLAEAAAQGRDGGFSASDITVIVDGRARNLAVTDVSGLDVSGSLSFPLLRGDLEISGSATYLMEFSRAATPDAPVRDVVDTIGNPVDWRVRLGAAWRGERFTFSTHLNYTDAY